MPAPPTVAADGAPAALAIVGGTLVTMDIRRTVGAFDVLVDEEGRISALAEPGQPVTAKRNIDALGQVIVPG